MSETASFIVKWFRFSGLNSLGVKYDIRRSNLYSAFSSFYIIFEQEASKQKLSPVSNNQGHEVKGSLPLASFSEQPVPIDVVLPSVDLGCTHLWLQSTVPLGLH
ncbi:Uncharacterized protein Fot_14292 [Forsythia ovata]|uniref:Uncharacterized protein n=1 Tax=Forsythia ovata TaxID=205694 RepID=A0ABD1W5Z2_9LAMI